MINILQSFIFTLSLLQKDKLKIFWTQKWWFFKKQTLVGLNRQHSQRGSSHETVGMSTNSRNFFGKWSPVGWQIVYEPF
jgi:hypothetical protein